MHSPSSARWRGNWTTGQDRWCPAASSVDFKVQPLHEELQELLGILLATARQESGQLIPSWSTDSIPCPNVGLYFPSIGNLKAQSNAAEAPAWSQPQTWPERPYLLGLPTCIQRRRERISGRQPGTEWGSQLHRSRGARGHQSHPQRLLA